MQEYNLKLTLGTQDINYTLIHLRRLVTTLSPPDDNEVQVSLVYIQPSIKKNIYTNRFEKMKKRTLTYLHNLITYYKSFLQQTTQKLTMM
jgi:hypothetical protein